jgi:hypothetical protein
VGKDSGRRAARALQPGAVVKERAGKAFFVSALTRANPFDLSLNDNKPSFFKKLAVSKSRIISRSNAPAWECVLRRSSVKWLMGIGKQVWITHTVAAIYD